MGGSTGGGKTSHLLWYARATQIGVVILVMAAWEIGSRSGLIDPELLPPISTVLSQIVLLFRDAAFRSDIEVTVLEILASFAIAAPVSLAVGFLIGESPKLKRMLWPPIEMLMTVPKSLLLPIYVILFGIGYAQKIIFAVTVAFFLIVPTAIASVQSVSPGFIQVAKVFGATRIQVYHGVYLPAVAPIVLNGLRMGLIFVVQGVIFAEMYGAYQGIGRRILFWGESVQMDRLMAAVLLVAIFTIGCNQLMQALETATRAKLNLD